MATKSDGTKSTPGIYPMNYNDEHLSACALLLSVDKEQLRERLDGRHIVLEDRAISIQDAAVALGCSRQTISRMIDRGDLVSIQVLESRKVLVSSVNIILGCTEK